MTTNLGRTLEQLLLTFPPQGNNPHAGSAMPQPPMNNPPAGNHMPQPVVYTGTLEPKPGKTKKRLYVGSEIGSGGGTA